MNTVDIWLLFGLLCFVRVPEEAPVSLVQSTTPATQAALHPEAGIWHEQQNICGVRFSMVGCRLRDHLSAVGGRGEMWSQ